MRSRRIRSSGEPLPTLEHVHPASARAAVLRLSRRPEVRMLAVLVVFAAGAWVLRAGPVIRGGTFTFGSDYDDVVNFSGAGLLTKGIFPYRDFFYAHPPGGLLLLAPFAAIGRWVGYDRAFLLAGSGMMLVGALNVFLIGRFCWRAWGPVAGVSSAVLYAWHPHVLVAERTVFMEPVLNLACITLATVWIGRSGAVSERRAFWAGVAAGAAISVKLWAVPWVVAAVIATPSERRGTVLKRFVLGGAAVLAVAVVPLALVGIGSVLDHVFGFHLSRPPDGGSSIQRTYELFGFLNGTRNVFRGPHAPTSLLAVVGLGVALLRARRPGARAERMAAGAYVLTLSWLMAAGVYYTHYNAHLALSETVAAGLGVSAAWEALRRFVGARQWGGRAAIGAACAVPVMALAAIAVPVSAKAALDGTRSRVPENRLIGAELRQLPSDACVFTFEPVWGLSGGRLPSRVGGGDVIPDPYGFMLLTSIRSGQRFDTADEAFAAEASQGDVRRFLSRCDYVVLGWRGYFQLSDASEAWLRAEFEPRPVGPSGLEIWQRRPE